MNYLIWLKSIHPLLPLCIAFAASIICGVLTNILLSQLLKKKYHSGIGHFIKIFYSYVKGPLYLLFIFFYLTLATSFLDVSEGSNIFRLISKIMLTAIISWLVIKLIDYTANWYLHRHSPRNSTISDHAPIYARLSLLKKTLQILVLVIAVALLLASFDAAREIGKGLLISAGVTGVIIGFALQKIITNLFYSYQLAFSKTLQVGDIVTVENEYGKIEEITLTHVVINLWDQRRLVLPLNHMIEKPYVNYSYPNPDILGTVFIYTDFTIDVEKLRQKFLQLITESPLWDKRVAKLQVTDINEQTLQIRVLVSAAIDSELFDLRCWVREKLMHIINQDFSQHRSKIHIAPLQHKNETTPV